MNKEIDRALELFHDVEFQAEKRQYNSIHPVARLMVTLAFIVTTISFGKYQLTRLLGMLVYLILLSFWEEIPILSMLKRVRVIIFMLILFGIANPILDRDEVYTIGNIVITQGMLSMITLFIKGIFTVCATYILVVEVGINGICVALRILKMPELLVTVVLLIYRYLPVLLQEVRNATLAYSLRAPRQKGISINTWGSFVGHILLRSMDRAQDVYDSMLLRGYNGSFNFERRIYRVKTSVGKSIVYAVGWIIVIVAFRSFPILDWIGELVRNDPNWR